VDLCGAIPKAQRFAITMSCCQAHPLLCRHIDKDLMATCEDNGDKLLVYMTESFSEDHMLMLTLRRTLVTDAVSSIYAHCGRIRKAAPPLALFSIMARSGDCLSYVKDNAGLLTPTTHMHIVKMLLSSIGEHSADPLILMCSRISVIEATDLQSLRLGHNMAIASIGQAEVICQDIYNPWLETGIEEPAVSEEIDKLSDWFAAGMGQLNASQKQGKKEPDRAHPLPGYQGKKVKAYMLNIDDESSDDSDRDGENDLLRYLRSTTKLKSVLASRDGKKERIANARVDKAREIDPAVPEPPLRPDPEVDTVKTERGRRRLAVLAGRKGQNIYWPVKGGLICYDVRMKVMSAHCKDPRHVNPLNPCRLNHTVDPKSRTNDTDPAGRPIGKLLAWLSDAYRHGNRQDHHGARLAKSDEDVLALGYRNRFSLREEQGGEDFEACLFERERRDGESIEPMHLIKS
jgi:hypothetical protein